MSADRLLDRDTIVAIATPPGRGGIGVVRLSGGEARSIAHPLLRLERPLEPGRARRTALLDADGEVLDQVVVTYFAAPHSYTSEDVVEISMHGAPVLLEHVLRRSVAAGARIAEPGEFTQRAFLSGRLDLTQAEAVHELVSAQTLQQARHAAAQLGGSISARVAPVKGALLALIAEMEAGVDFAEDDLDLLAQDVVLDRIDGLHEALQPLRNSYTYGRLLREGARLAIVGRPNAGKSSLFNRLLAHERSIVTAQAGTTRDAVSDHAEIGGIPVELVDTAGLRQVAETPDTDAERQGMARTRALLAEADLAVHVVDVLGVAGAGELSGEDQAIQELLDGRPSLLVFNKCDLLPDSALAGRRWPSAIPVSAMDGRGFDALKLRMAAVLGAQPATDSAIVTNLRQAEVLARALAALDKAAEAAAGEIPHEFLLLDLYEALRELDALTGASSPDDVLALIFSRFCIGK